MPQTSQDMRARLQANAQTPLYDGNYTNGNRPYMTASGTIGHGLPLTITSNRFTFGTKSHTTAPHLWETFQGGNDGDSVNTYNSTWTKYLGPQPTDRDAKVSTDHARYPGSKAAMNDSDHGFSTNYKSYPAGRKLYASHWAYVETRGTDTGKITSVTTNSVTVAGKNWVTNNWTQYVLKITAGTGSNDALNHILILSNTNDTLTFDMTGSGGWWTYLLFNSGASAGVDVPYTVSTGSEVSIDTTGAGDAYGPWSTNNGVIRIGQRIRVRSMVNGASGVVKIGSDVNNPIATVTAVFPDTTSVFKIVPQVQLKQSRYTTNQTNDASPHYNNTGTHGVSSWHFHTNNDSLVELFYGSGSYVKTVRCPINEWYRVEATIYLSDPGVSNGYYSVTVTTASGVKSTATYTNIMSRTSAQSFLFNEYLIGVMFANVVTHSLKAYCTDIYLESDTWSRIEIGNHKNYALCTIREPQPFTSWGNTSITINQNVASIPGPKYLFFIDDNNNATLVTSLALGV